MPIRGKDLNPATYSELARLFQAEQSHNAQPGVVPSSNAANAFFGYQPASNEQEREGQYLDEASKRTGDVWTQSGEARARGFNGPNPIEQREQADFADKMKLAQVPGQSALALEREKGTQRLNELDKFAQVMKGGGHAPVPDSSAPAGTMSPLAHALSTQKAVGAYAADHNAGPATAPKTYLNRDANGNESAAPAPGGPVSANQVDEIPPEIAGGYKPQPELTARMGVGGPTMSLKPEPKLSVTERGNVENLRNAWLQTHEARKLIDQLYPTPGPELTPATTPGFLGQLGHMAKAEGAFRFYQGGAEDPALMGDPQKADLYKRVAALISLAGAQAKGGFIHGIRNYQWLNEIGNHLANGGQPTASQRSRMDLMLHEYPEMIKTIYSTAYGEPRTDLSDLSQ